jgi:hypothetical protein
VRDALLNSNEKIRPPKKTRRSTWTQKGRNMGKGKDSDRERERH